jgi:four helix bundle protein
MTNVKKEKVYDLHSRTRAFGVECILLSTRLPKSDVSRIIGNQLIRSSTSVGANYAEADHARSKAEFKSKIGDCLKEAAESKYWLLVLQDCLYKDARIPRLLDESQQLEKILYTIKG